jgi:hypothetical protein
MFSSSSIFWFLNISGCFVGSILSCLISYIWYSSSNSHCWSCSYSGSCSSSSTTSPPKLLMKYSKKLQYFMTNHFTSLSYIPALEVRWIWWKWCSCLVLWDFSLLIRWIDRTIIITIIILHVPHPWNPISLIGLHSSCRLFLSSISLSTSRNGTSIINFIIISASSSLQSPPSGPWSSHYQSSSSLGAILFCWNQGNVGLPLRINTVASSGGAPSQQATIAH